MATYSSKPMGLINQGRQLLPGKFVYQGSITSTSGLTGTAVTATNSTYTMTISGITIPVTDQVYVLKYSGQYSAVVYTGSVYKRLSTSNIPDEATSATAYPAYISYWAINDLGSHIIGALTYEDYTSFISNAAKLSNDVAVFYKVHQGQCLKDFALTFIMSGFVSPAGLTANTAAGLSDTTTFRYAYFPGQDANPIERGEAGVTDKLILIHKGETTTRYAGVKINNAFAQVNGTNYFKLAEYSNVSDFKYCNDFQATIADLPKEAAKQIEVLISPNTSDVQSCVVTFVSSANIPSGNVALSI